MKAMEVSEEKEKTRKQEKGLSPDDGHTVN